MDQGIRAPERGMKASQSQEFLPHRVKTPSSCGSTVSILKVWLKSWGRKGNRGTDCNLTGLSVSWWLFWQSWGVVVGMAGHC